MNLDWKEQGVMKVLVFTLLLCFAISPLALAGDFVEIDPIKFPDALSITDIADRENGVARAAEQGHAEAQDTLYKMEAIHLQEELMDLTGISDMITLDENVAEPLPDTPDASSASVSSVDYVPSVLTRPKHNAYAVIIGIESYRDLPTVDFAQRDAATMKTYLIKAMGYQEEHIILLQNGDATRSDFIAYFETWLPNHVDADSEVFVFYAGHGSHDPVSGQPYLVPYNGKPAYLKDTAYPIDRLYETLAELPAKQVVVALDSCFSGLGGRSVIQKGVRPMMLTVEDPVLASDKLIVVSAAQGDQISTAFPKQQHGLFTYYFIKGLQGAADADDDGVVALDELFTYLQPQVTRQARRMNIDQEPSISPSLPLLRERGAIPLVTLSPEPF